MGDGLEGENAVVSQAVGGGGDPNWSVERTRIWQAALAYARAKIQGIRAAGWAERRPARGQSRFDLSERKPKQRKSVRFKGRVYLYMYVSYGRVRKFFFLSQLFIDGLLRH